MSQNLVTYAAKFHAEGHYLAARLFCIFAVEIIQKTKASVFGHADVFGI
jgi:hypothetical protein